MTIRLFLLMILLTGCNTLDPDTEFGTSSEEAFVLLVANGLDGHQSHLWSRTADTIFGLKRVDLENSEFVDNGYVRMELGLRTLKDVDPSVRFAAANAAPGHYALVGVTVIGSRRHHICYSMGTSVYEIKKGQVNLITLDSSAMTSLISQGAEASSIGRGILDGYPGITAPLVSAEPANVISFATPDRPFMGQKCDTSGSFRIVL